MMDRKESHEAQLGKPDQRPEQFNHQGLIVKVSKANTSFLEFPGIHFILLFLLSVTIILLLTCIYNTTRIYLGCGIQ